MVVTQKQKTKTMKKLSILSSSSSSSSSSRIILLFVATTTVAVLLLVAVHSSSSSPPSSSSSVPFWVTALTLKTTTTTTKTTTTTTSKTNISHPKSDRDRDRRFHSLFVHAVSVQKNDMMMMMEENSATIIDNNDQDDDIDQDDEVRSNDSGASAYPKRRDVILRSVRFLPLTAAAAVASSVVLSQPQSSSAAAATAAATAPPPALLSSSLTSSSNVLSATAVVTDPGASSRTKCTDIESCREIGEQKVQQDLQDNPVIRLPNGVRYKKLKAGIGSAVVNENDVVDIIYSISRANGAYMYSVGFGYNKAASGDGFSSTTTDEGIESYRVKLGRHDLPTGVESALVGARKGERRRIEVPPSVGFETSDWKPEPTTRRGKAQIADYRSQMKGRGTSQPPFFAPLIWEVEILNFRRTTT